MRPRPTYQAPSTYWLLAGSNTTLCRAQTTAFPMPTTHTLCLLQGADRERHPAGCTSVGVNRGHGLLWCRVAAAAKKSSALPHSHTRSLIHTRAAIVHHNPMRGSASQPIADMPWVLLLLQTTAVATEHLQSMDMPCELMPGNCTLPAQSLAQPPSMLLYMPRPQRHRHHYQQPRQSALPQPPYYKVG